MIVVDPLARANDVLDVVKSSRNFALVRGCAIRKPGDCADRVRLRNRGREEQRVERNVRRSLHRSSSPKIDAKLAGAYDAKKILAKFIGNKFFARPLEIIQIFSS